MGVLSLILLILFGIVSVLLTIIVALQDEGDSGLGGVFGGSGGSLFGAATSKVVIKITSVLAAVFLALALTFAIINKTSVRDSLLNNVNETVQTDVDTTTQWYSN